MKKKKNKTASASHEDCAWGWANCKTISRSKRFPTPIKEEQNLDNISNNQGQKPARSRHSVSSAAVAVPLPEIKIEDTEIKATSAPSPPEIKIEDTEEIVDELTSKIVYVSYFNL
jgi:hypothetical protein